MKIETTTLILGETEYTIKTAPFKRSRVWRQQLLDEVKPLFDKVTEAQGVRFETPEDLLQLWPLVSTVLNDGIESIFDLLIAYDPQLAEAEEQIEQTATDKQIMAAFQQVLKLTDPFGLSQLFERKVGLAMTTTSPSLPSPNGASPSSKQATSASIR